MSWLDPKFIAKVLTQRYFKPPSIKKPALIFGLIVEDPENLIGEYFNHSQQRTNPLTIGALCMDGIVVNPQIITGVINQFSISG